ncbi:sulfur oxidation c-type cytochrome SoxA [Ideonella sp. A 288]|uniref:sulfur oxidation c-type cytochrome SoxA n=1 Tax=Ideonella sp. A 288 TaxID=1962181 RepID=UPI000B4BF1DF|nr:sulfur oxidation c-type cytochrome SoxA [Ideonella sp. A 288]
MACTAAAAAALAVAAAHAADDARRPGSAFMSPALQAMQADDSLNPAQLWVKEGEALWSRPPANGRACSGCHAAGSERGMASRYPAYDASLGRPVTLAGRIDACRQRHQQAAPQGADGPELLALAAWLAQASRGLPLAPPDHPRLAPWAARGERLWQLRLGQLNLACASCHDQHAGQRLGGAPIPQAHPTGYPTYRLEWQGLGSLPRRVRSCLAGVRAEPFAADSDDGLAIELHLARRAAGMPLEGPAVRP